MYGQPRPCKFGATCRNLATGTCRFYHPENQVPNQGQNQPPMGQSRPQNPFDKGGFHSGGPRGGGSGGGGNPRGGPYNPNPNPNPNPPRNRPQNSGDVSNQLCRMFHLDMQCKFGEKCNRKHYFNVKNPESIRRFQFMREIPLHTVSKLTQFNSGEKNFYVMRNNLDINIFEYNLQTKTFNDVYKWQLPDPNGKFTFYDHKNENIYFSRQNPDMHFQDLGFYNLKTQKNYIVMNAHRGKITGVVHFNQSILFSTSMDGQLKVWSVSGQTLISQNAESDKVKSLFNPQNANIQLYFIDISIVNSAKITSVGTSDGRLIFFIGDNLDYQHVVLGYIECKVFQVRYTTRQGNPMAVILTWNHNKTHSAILEIDLSNGFKIRPLVQLSTTSDQPKNTIHLFEFVHGYLMVATLSGFISIYEYPDTSAKIGGIHLQNTVSQNIVQSCDQLKNTNIKVKTMLILEKRTDKNPGSLGIYHIQ